MRCTILSQRNSSHPYAGNARNDIAELISRLNNVEGRQERQGSGIMHTEAAPLPASGPQSASLFRAGVTHPRGSGLAFAAAASGFASRLA
jgi:hypothetical protein